MWLVKKSRTPYWQVRFPAHDGSGRVIQVSTGETSKRAAEKRAVEIEAGHAAAWKLTRKGGDVTVLGVSEQYWDSELSKRKWAKTAFIYLRKIIDFLGDDRAYCTVTITDAAAFLDTVDGTVSDATINRILAIWRRMHNYAAKVRGYPVKPIEWAQLMRQEPAGRTRHLSLDEIKRLLSKLPERAQEIVLFGLTTGVRKDQILKLAWDRIDLEHGTASIWLKSRKAYVTHTIDLNPSAMAIIERRRAHGTTGLVFDTRNFRKTWEAALVEAEIPDFRFHDLRHTFATHLARHASLAIVQRFLGHSNITTTMRYSHVQRDDMRAAVNGLPEMTLIERSPDRT